MSWILTKKWKIDESSFGMDLERKINKNWLQQLRFCVKFQILPMNFDEVSRMHGIRIFVFQNGQEPVSKGGSFCKTAPFSISYSGLYLDLFLKSIKASSSIFLSTAIRAFILIPCLETSRM